MSNDNLHVLAASDGSQNTVVQAMKDMMTQSDPNLMTDDIKTLKDIEENNTANADDLPDSMVATVAINPSTGEQMVVDVTDTDNLDDDVDKYLTPEEVKEIEDRLTRNMEELDHLHLTTKEIYDATSQFGELDMKDISEEDAYAIIDVVKRMQANEKFSVYHALPEIIKERITAVVSKEGFGGYSNQSKQGRNLFARYLMDCFINELQRQRAVHDLDKELRAINNEMTEDIVGFIVENQEERHKFFEKYIKKYEDENDLEGAEKMRRLLNAICDGFTLEPLKEAARNHKIKIKKIDIEKPNRIIDTFQAKYEKTDQWNIYSIYDAMQVLFRNTRGEDPMDPEDIYRFFVAFCKFCRNYQPHNTFEHAFMYYVVYNCRILDYKGKDGKNQNFIDGYIANVKEVVSLLKGENNAGSTESTC